MRKSLHISIFTVLFLTFGVSVFAQTAEQIKQIRAEVNLINKNAAKYKKTKRNVEGISLEGTEATYFVSGKGLKKVTAKMFGETYNATVEIYFSGEEMIFAFLKENRYDTQIGMNPPPKVVRTEERRFYFSSGNLIRLLVGKTEVKSGSENYRELKEQIEDIAAKIKTAY